MFVTLDDVRLHLNLETDDLDDDMQARLNLYINASFELVKVYLNCEIYEEQVPEEESNGIVFTDDMKIAQLLIIGDMFNDRENSSNVIHREVPLTAQKILNKKRRFNV